MSIESQNPAVEAVALTPREQALVKTIRLLGEILPDAFDQVEEQVWKLVGQHLKWSWSDPESLRRATQFMGLDPEIRRESKAISEDFAFAEGDGLQSLDW
jgi:hypothetical protein